MAHSTTYVRLMNSSAWRSLRNEVISAQPICQECGRKVSQCVHHIVEVESGRTDAEMERIAFNRANLQALCFECHNAIHKAKRSHSKEAHRQRQAEALERFKQRIQPNINKA